MAMEIVAIPSETLIDSKHGDYRTCDSDFVSCAPWRGSSYYRDPRSLLIHRAVLRGPWGTALRSGAHSLYLAASYGAVRRHSRWHSRCTGAEPSIPLGIVAGTFAKKRIAPYCSPVCARPRCSRYNSRRDFSVFDIQKNSPGGGIIGRACTYCYPVRRIPRLDESDS